MKCIFGEMEYKIIAVILLVISVISTLIYVSYVQTNIIIINQPPSHQAGTLYPTSSTGTNVNLTKEEHIPNTFKSGRFLTWVPQGRLGNLIFEFACAYSLSHRLNYTLILNQNNKIFSYFPHLRVLKVNTSVLSILKLELIKTHSFGTYKRNFIENKIQQYKRVNINGFFQSWKYMRGYEEDIRGQLKVTEHHKQRAEDLIRKITQEYTAQFSTGDEINGINYVGVHVRRGDVTDRTKKNMGFTAAPLSYIHKAMNHFKNLHTHVIFIVCSDDIKWCKSKLKSNASQRNIYFPHGDTIEDFSLLSYCNDSVITTGSYGWWAGWLAGGKVVYYKLFPTPGSKLYSLFNTSDYYPPHWIPMK